MKKKHFPIIDIKLTSSTLKAKVYRLCKTFVNFHLINIKSNLNNPFFLKLKFVTY